MFSSESPFPYERIADKKTFYGREEEIKKIFSFFDSSTNLLIHSKRRMGKSTLIKELFRRHEKDFLCIYVDIFDITSKEDFAKALLKALSNADSKTDIRKAISFLSKLFKRTRLEPSIDPITLEYSLKPVVTSLSFEEMMEDFCFSLKEIAKKRKIVLAIDEFQQISIVQDWKLDAYLRKEIQELSNISCIFLGSKRHLLTSLFEYKAPLFEMATHFELQPLQFNDIQNYVTSFLAIDEDELRYVCELADYETKLMQNIFHILYLRYGKNKKIEKEAIDSVVEEIINAKDASYRMIYDFLSPSQKMALRILAKHKKNIYHDSVLTEYAIKKNTLQTAIKALFHKELIDKLNDSFYIPERSLELWCERRFV